MARATANGSAYYAFGYSDDLGAWTFEKSGQAFGDGIAGAAWTSFTAKLRVQTVDGSVVLSYKKWESGDEPAEWSVGPTDSSSPLLSGFNGIKMATSACAIGSYLAESEAAEETPGLPGGAADPSRVDGFSAEESRATLQLPFKYGRKLPPLPPKRSDMAWLTQRLRRR
jgi:hypothetical protein